MHGGSFVYDPWSSTPPVCSTTRTCSYRPPRPRQKRLGEELDVPQPPVRARTCELIDPKGEYTPLTQALGGQVLTFTPGGQTRLNPLTRLGSREMREGLLEAIARAMLDGHSPSPKHSASPPALAPPTAMPTARTSASPMSPRAATATPARTSPTSSPTRTGAQADLRECALALQRLTHGPAARHVRPAHPASEQVWDAPAVCLGSLPSRVG